MSWIDRPSEALSLFDIEITSEEAPPDEASSERVPPTESGAAEPYDYGPPPLEARESNFISDENLMLWLAQKQEGLYGELREHMDMSRTRSKLIADLSHLKDSLDNTDDPTEVRAKIDSLLDAYAGTPFEEELGELLVPLRDALEVAQREAYLPGTDNDEIADIKAAIQPKIDELGRDDQLELVQIQSLTGDIREASQLASNLIASSNQATNTIVGNIGR